MSRSSVPSFVPTLEQSIELLYDSVFYEIVFAFGVSSHDTSDYCSWEHVNFSRMGHARVLYSFFETPKSNRQKDDAVSEDFGFLARTISRPASDKERLNKQLFHLTYARLELNRTSKAWPDSILSCLQGTCVEFIEHLLKCGPPFVDNEDDTRNWEELRDRLKSGDELLISRPALPNGIAPYTFARGLRFQSGQSELTKLVARVE